MDSLLIEKNETVYKQSHVMMSDLQKAWVHVNSWHHLGSLSQTEVGRVFPWYIKQFQLYLSPKAVSPSICCQITVKLINYTINEKQIGKYYKWIYATWKNEHVSAKHVFRRKIYNAHLRSIKGIKWNQNTEFIH